MNRFESSRSRMTRFAALLFFIAALSLIILLRLFERPEFLEWYKKYADSLIRYENWVQSNASNVFIVFLILLNYVLKAVIPWLPITVMMMLSGMIFNSYTAIAINVVGCSILFAIKFFWGRKWGGGNAEKVLSKYNKAHLFIESGKLGSSMVLFLSRLTPMVPINSVSQLYGTTSISFWRYLIISLAGFAYKLFSYTIIGRNVYNPLSWGFLGPVIALLIVSGLMLLLINAIITASTPIIHKFKSKIQIKRRDKNGQ